MINWHTNQELENVLSFKPLGFLGFDTSPQTQTNAIFTFTMRIYSYFSIYG